MTIEKIFSEWVNDIPFERKVQLAKEIVMISGDTNLTPEEERISQEAEKFLLEEE